MRQRRLTSALAQAATIKMFGFLKNFLTKTKGRTTNSTSAPAIKSSAQAFSSTYSGSPSSVQPLGVRQSFGQHNGNGMGVQVSLQKILAGLPLELQHRVCQPNVGEQTIPVRLEKILPQLSRGTVKISFGELRQAAPGLFSGENDQDWVLVALPLADILSQLNPKLIARRRVQRQVEVPADISSPFDPSRLGLFGGEDSAETQPVVLATSSRQVSPAAFKPAAPARGGLGSIAPPPQPAIQLPSTALQSPASIPLKLSPDVAAHGAAPGPVAKAPSAPAPIALRPAVPASSPAAITPSAPTSFAPTPPSGPPRLTPSTPPQMPTTVPAAKAAPTPPSPPIVSASPATSRAPIRVARETNGDYTVVASPSAPLQLSAKSEPAAEPLLLAMGALAKSWPDVVRKEILELNLTEATVAMPAQVAEQALKQGRIAFPWKTIRSWVKPAVPATASPHDSLVLDLPLEVVAPLFLARHRPASKAQRKVSVDEAIPNPFSGFPQAETHMPAGAPAAPPSDTNHHVEEDTCDTGPEQESEVECPTPGANSAAKFASPNEIVSRAAALEGVAGALIALADGLTVANRLPADLHADTLAAFLPQIFAKVSQCAKELHMGELNDLNFTVGNVSWKIFRVNAIFFAAFGREGEALPTAQLAALAAELDQQPK